MTYLHALILGLIEGITEFLPISSTGHLILAGKVLGIPVTDFVKTFDISIQLGAILAVVVLYAKTILTKWGVVKRVIVAFIPTGIIGLVAYKVIKQYLLGNESVVLWALLLGGVCLIVFELFHHEKEQAISDVEHISYKQAFTVGLFQSVAMIPGVSRSAATIIGGMLLGIKRTTIVEFSFLLAIPTMAAATGLDLIKNASAFSSQQAGFFIVGFLASFAAAFMSARWLLKYIQKHTFIPFGVYRIVVAILFFLVFIKN